MRLLFCLRVYCYPHLILGLCLPWRSCVNNLNLLTIRVTIGFVAWRFSFEPARLTPILAIVINSWVVEVLIKVLNRLVDIWTGVSVRSAHLSPRDALIILLVEQFYECVVWHLFSCLYESFSLKLNVWFLCEKLLVKCLLHLDWSSYFIWVQVAHVREAHAERFSLSFVKLRFFISCVRTWHQIWLSFVDFKLSVENLRIHIVLLCELRSEELFYRLDSAKLHTFIAVVVTLSITVLLFLHFGLGTFEPRLFNWRFRRFRFYLFFTQLRLIISVTAASARSRDCNKL